MFFDYLFILIIIYFLKEKFYYTNTDMSLNEINVKLNKFCKENKLECKKDGKNKFIIGEKNLIDSFWVEVINSSPFENRQNIIKFYQGKNTGPKMKEISAKLFIEIVNI